MALRQTKKISELTALESASLQTTLLGVDNGTTYKVTLDVLEDAIINMVSRSTDLRLDSLEAYTASANAASDLSPLNSFTSSQNTLNSAFTTGINARLQTSSFNDFSASVHSEILSATNEQSFNGLVSGSSQFTASYDERYVLSGSITQTTWDNIANKPNDIVSSSTQIADLGFVTGSYAYLTQFNSLTQSFNIISGSVVNITNAVDVTQLNNTTASLNSFTSSYYTDSASFNSRIIAATNEQNLSHLVTTSSFNSYTASISTGSLVNRLNAIENISGSWITENETGSFLTSLNGTISGSGQITALGFVSGSYETTGRGIISSSANLVTTSSFNSYTASISTASLVTSINNLNSATSSYLASLSGAISSSSQLTSSFDTRYAPSASYLTSLNGAFSSSIQTLGGSGVYSSSAQLPSGLISGSSQLTASYDTRYTLSGSISAVPVGTISGSAQITAFGFVSSSTSVPAGTISGSSQLTSSFDGRYVQTGSFNTLTASFNSFTASAQSVTTGSNSFNGTQTITGSLIITTGSFVGSQILANTSSLYLTSGSNMYVQNNGVVEITGSLKVNGITRFETVGGDEGGEIEFGVPQTNTTLSTRVVQDIWQNRLRIFDGNTKGVFIDLSKAPIGVAGEITWKSSGYVDAGTFVQLDNIKASVTTSGNRGLSIGAVSTNFSANIGGTFSNSAGAGGNSTQNIAYTTTASTSVFGWNFIAEGDTSTYIINDKTNSRMYRITMMIGPAYLGNFISIERLH